MKVPAGKPSPRRTASPQRSRSAIRDMLWSLTSGQRRTPPAAASSNAPKIAGWSRSNSAQNVAIAAALFGLDSSQWHEDAAVHQVAAADEIVDPVQDDRAAERRGRPRDRR